MTAFHGVTTALSLPRKKCHIQMQILFVDCTATCERGQRLTLSTRHYDWKQTQPASTP